MPLPVTVEEAVVVADGIQDRQRLRLPVLHEDGAPAFPDRGVDLEQADVADEPEGRDAR
ncbi:MAG TPA: hypothetical protein VIU62_16965 [Chloroflexota bacterium]|jgi:hypothetical protein